MFWRCFFNYFTRLAEGLDLPVEAWVLDSPPGVLASAYERDPSSVTSPDFQKLHSEFGDQGALDVVLLTCSFAFMNWFADALEIPSEDIAVQTYQQVYGTDRK